MRFVAVLNRDGGTLRTMDLDTFAAQAEAIFARHGHALDPRIVAGDEVERVIEAAAAAPDVDVVMVAGGDGTVSTGAAIGFRTGKPIAILPAGTMNLFARSLKTPLDLTAALEAIAAGSLDKVDIATANGRPFVHQFGVGVHARLVQIRENMSYDGRVGKMMASLRAIAAAAANPPNFEAEFRTPTGTQRRRATGISITNNPMGEGHVPHADQLDQGVLGVYVAAPLTSSALIRLAFGIITGRWRDNPFVSEQQVEQLTLHFPKHKRSAKAVVDGELVDLERSVKLQVHPRALNIIMPGAVVAQDATAS